SDAVRIGAVAQSAGKERITSRPPAPPAPRLLVQDDSPIEPPPHDARDTDVPTARRKPRREEPVDEIVEVVMEDLPEVEAVEEPPPKRRPKKKKRKKKQAYLPAEEEQDRETPAWVWWAFGGGGIAVTLLTLLLVALLASTENPLKVDAAYLLVAQPISMMIFFGAMILANFIAEAVDFGEIHVAIMKTFFVVLAINVVSLVPLGRWITVPLWPVALMIVFHLDYFEACIVSLFNWGLNYLLNLFLLAMLSGWIMHGGGGRGGNIDIDRPSNAPAANEPEDVWHEDDITQLGGKVQYGSMVDGQVTIAAIWFVDLPIGDAELAHMKDFPYLVTLDLT